MTCGQAFGSRVAKFHDDFSVAHGGETRKQFDVVVPLSEADYQDGYPKCRYVANPTD